MFDHHHHSGTTERHHIAERHESHHLHNAEGGHLARMHDEVHQERAAATNRYSDGGKPKLAETVRAFPGHGGDGKSGSHLDITPVQHLYRSSAERNKNEGADGKKEARIEGHFDARNDGKK